MLESELNMKKIEIWYPRFSKRDLCILAKHIRSTTETYEIHITKDPSYAGCTYKMTGEDILNNASLEKTKQGNKTVYAIPLSKLEEYKEIK